MPLRAAMMNGKSTYFWGPMSVVSLFSVISEYGDNSPHTVLLFISQLFQNGAEMRGAGWEPAQTLDSTSSEKVFPNPSPFFQNQVLFFSPPSFIFPFPGPLIFDTL